MGKTKFTLNYLVAIAAAAMMKATAANPMPTMLQSIGDSIQ
jgi:hypothetical protein